MAACAKELRATLLEIVPSTDATGRSFIADLFRPREG
jgi:hypothetical protein